MGTIQFCNTSKKLDSLHIYDFISADVEHICIGSQFLLHLFCKVFIIFELTREKCLIYKFSKIFVWKCRLKCCLNRRCFYTWRFRWYYSCRCGWGRLCGIYHCHSQKWDSKHAACAHASLFPSILHIITSFHPYLEIPNPPVHYAYTWIIRNLIFFYNA